MADPLTSGIVDSLQEHGVDACYQGRGYFRAGRKRFALVEEPESGKAIAVLSESPRLLVDYGNPRMLERILVSIGWPIVDAYSLSGMQIESFRNST